MLANGGKVMLAPDPEVLDADVAVIADPLGTLVGVLEWDYPASEGAIGP